MCLYLFEGGKRYFYHYTVAFEVQWSTIRVKSFRKLGSDTFDVDYSMLGALVFYSDAFFQTKWLKAIEGAELESAINFNLKEKSMNDICSIFLNILALSIPLGNAKQ